MVVQLECWLLLVETVSMPLCCPERGRVSPLTGCDSTIGHEVHFCGILPVGAIGLKSLKSLIASLTSVSTFSPTVGVTLVRAAGWWCASGILVSCGNYKIADSPLMLWSWCTGNALDTGSLGSRADYHKLFSLWLRARGHDVRKTLFQIDIVVALTASRGLARGVSPVFRGPALVASCSCACWKGVDLRGREATWGDPESCNLSP